MKQNYLFLTAAVTSLLMLSACTSKDETVTIVSNQGNELMISTRNDMAITRADGGTAENPGLQQSQFDSGETIDVFLQDATDPSTGTSYSNPIKYRTDGNGNLYTYNYTPASTPTLPHTAAPYDHWYDAFTSASPTPTVNRLFWPKLTHALNIYGVYPEGAVSDNTKVGVSFLPFSDTEKYTFSVQVDQTDYEAYKESDLMTGRPITYTPGLTEPYKLAQAENPGTIILTFAHRLTKIVVNVTKTKDTEDTDIDLRDIKYDGAGDKKYAVVTLMGIDKTIQFLVNSEDGLGRLSGNTTNIIVGKGAVTREISISAPAYPGAILTSDTYDAVSLAAIIPPQTITGGNLFIEVDLINEDLGTPIYDKFYYNAPSNITLSPKNVYTYNIRISKPHIDVTTTITPWDDDDNDEAAGNNTSNAIGVLQ